MSEISEEYVNSIVKEVAAKQKLHDWRYTKGKLGAIAQNYFGILIPIDLTGKIDGNEVCYNLMLKLAPTDEQFRVSGAITLMFAREIYVYSTIFSQFQQLQSDYTVTNEFIMPQCYYVRKENCNEVIVMENMCSSGYEPYLRSNFLDVDHAAVALNSLGKFHALSFVLKYKDEALFKEAFKRCVPLNKHTNKRFMEILQNRLAVAMPCFENKKYVDLLQNLSDNCVKYIEDTVKCVKETVICHGDLWKENILFKYEDGKPIAACCIDYQTARRSSPAFDVLYLIASSTNQELRKKHYIELINIYYDSFKYGLIESELHADTVYSRKDLEHDLKCIGPACFIIANTALWLSAGLQEEGHVRSKNVLATAEQKKEARDRYTQAIANIIDDFYEYGYFSTLDL